MLRLLIRAVPCLLLANCASPRPAAKAFHSPPIEAEQPEELPIRQIVIDPGHGGQDPGAMYHGLREKDLALDIGLRLRDDLAARGLAVTMTRDHDEFIALSKRSNVANRLPADLFLSVHINANPNHRISGVEVYYPKESVVDTDSSFPPGIESTEVAVPTWTIKQILWDLVLVRSRRASTRVASHVCRALRDQLGVPCRGVKGARFVVLREAQMPAVLVEVGFVSNQPEAGRLASQAYRGAIAKAIADGVISYARELAAQRQPSSVKPSLAAVHREPDSATTMTTP